MKLKNKWQTEGGIYIFYNQVTLNKPLGSSA